MVETNCSRFSSVRVSQFFDSSEEKPTIDASGERRSWAAVAIVVAVASYRDARPRRAAAPAREAGAAKMTA